MLLQVIDRADDAFADRERRPPAECAKTAAIEKDERTVANPAAIADIGNPYLEEHFPRLDYIKKARVIP